MKRQRWCRIVLAVLAGGTLLQTSSSCRGQFMSTLVDSLTSSFAALVESQVTSIVEDALTSDGAS